MHSTKNWKLQRRPCAIVLASALLLGGCGGNGAEAGPPSAPASQTATPVQAAQVTLRTIDRVVSAPGRTTSTDEETIRAPFPGTVRRLEVTEGDHVRGGDTVATIVARDSEAQLNGAMEMQERARTAQQRKDAQRALRLAKENLVETELTSSVNGVVSSRAVVAGERVGDNQDLLTIASLQHLVFVADVDQARMTGLKSGDAALVHLSGVDHVIHGRVQAVLPATAPDMTTPVRIELNEPPGSVSVGLTGTADIVVARHENVPSVPASAVLRDDVSGQQKIAIVDDKNRIRWQQVQTGYARNGHVELLQPRIAPGTTVVTTGQVGLSEGTPVTVSQ